MKLAPLIVLALLAGCPSKKKASERIDDAVEGMNGFANQMCQCKDIDCAEKVHHDMNAWAAKVIESTPPRDQSPNEAQTKRMTEVGTHYDDCFSKLLEVDAIIRGGSAAVPRLPDSPPEPK